MEEIEISKTEQELGKLVGILLSAYAVEQVQGVPLKQVQVDHLFSEYTPQVLTWRQDALSDRTGPLNLMDFALFVQFQLLGSVVSLSMLLEEAQKLLPAYERAKLALKVGAQGYAQKAGDRMEKLLG